MLRNCKMSSLSVQNSFVSIIRLKIVTAERYGISTLNDAVISVEFMIGRLKRKGAIVSLTSHGYVKSSTAS